MGHLILDLLGAIPLPGVGEAADLLNAFFYALEGDEFNVGLSLGAAALPVAGSAIAIAGRFGDEAVGLLQRLSREDGGAIGFFGRPVGGNPADRATFEAYLDELIVRMGPPHVVDGQLRSIVDRLYRPGASVGSGSTAAAVRFERTTGLPVGGRSHTQKAEEEFGNLNRWLESNSTGFAERPGSSGAAAP